MGNSGLYSRAEAFVENLRQRKILNLADAVVQDKYELLAFVVLLKAELQRTYPQIKLKRRMRSVHYANGFQDKTLQEIAYLLDDIEQYLSYCGLIDHDTAVKYFNKRITTEGVVLTEDTLLETMLDSLML